MDERIFIYNFVKKELIGPSNDLTDTDGEEIVLYDPPHIRYISGILYPQKDLGGGQDNDYVDSKTNEIFDDSDNDEISPNVSDFDSPADLTDDAEDSINLSNAFKQSAISMTIAVNSLSGVNITVNTATYMKINYQKDGKDVLAFKRHPLTFSLDGSKYEMPKKKQPYKETVYDGKNKTELEIRVFYRYSKSNVDVYTISLVNNHESSNNTEYLYSFFQAELVVSSSSICPLPEILKVARDEDYDNNVLLYRNEKKYAIGHGCSPIWDSENENKTIRSSFLPFYETNAVTPKLFPNISLSMYDLSGRVDDKTLIANLLSLTQEYDKWISKLESRKNELTSEEWKIAAKNIESCKECSNRIKNGIAKLVSDPISLEAFKYMNEAMLLQQLHYNIKKREWVDNEYVLKNSDFVMPDIDNKETWGRIKGQWRPFQIAFILLNIVSITENENPEHQNVELIWFPTGGGKTEAYLGLSAFTIFYRRLVNKNDFGTDILMRYTLRLLTAQQYERAATLICCADYIRHNNIEKLGENRISIGLWVGSKTTPNNSVDAYSKWSELNNNKNSKSPFIIAKCPWCGASMGPSDSSKDLVRDRGYGVTKKNNNGKWRFFYKCSNPDCHFFHHELPLDIVDEQIYSNPPTLLIGTVDKFATLPFVPQSQSIFGIKNGNRVKNVSLIIQDELHLISGPLGSTVSLYETMIDYLCSDYSNPTKPIVPKIIASTATISQAKAQCKNLFCRKEEQVKIFPPSGIDAGESFFAEVNKTNPGRLYVGIYAPGSSSVSTTSIHLLSSLLQCGRRIPTESDFIRDAYWTNIVYFNSLRELGTAATWINADIREYSKTINKRISDNLGRYPNNHAELTSRIDGYEVQEYLEKLNIDLATNKNKVIDICLATNMISVGLDIQRLGLMTVSGQPKTTSEYIQATSRVGRDKERPGIVFTLYSPLKPRDKSIFENFVNYHSKMYTYVEPMSVTPFSPQLRDRALAAVFFGIIRLLNYSEGNDYPQQAVVDEALLNTVKNQILHRVSFIDKDELQNSSKQIDSIILMWKNQNPSSYSPSFNKWTKTNTVPCFYPNSMFDVDDTWKDNSNPIPTSMRNVDQECQIKPRAYEVGYGEDK